MNCSRSMLGLLAALAGTPAAATTDVPGSYFQSSGSGSTSHTTFPGASVTSSADPGEFAFASLNYYFKVVGPTNGSALVNVTGLLSAGETLTGPSLQYFYGSLPQYDEYSVLTIGQSPYYEGGSYFLQAGIGAAGFRGAENGFYGSPKDTVSFSSDGLSATQSSSLRLKSSLLLPANTLLDINLYAAVGGTYNDPGKLTSTGLAFADPFLEIDRDFATQNPGYSLVLSSDVGNSPLSAVPEPASWAMMIGGFGLVGGVLRAARGSDERFTRKVRRLAEA